MSIRLRKPLANVWKNIIKVKILLFLDFLHNVRRIISMTQTDLCHYNTNLSLISQPTLSFLSPCFFQNTDQVCALIPWKQLMYKVPDESCLRNEYASMCAVCHRKKKEQTPQQFSKVTLKAASVQILVTLRSFISLSQFKSNFIDVLK